MAVANYVSKVSPRNKVFADRIRALADKYSIIGIIDVSSLPAPQFQRIRASIKKSAEVLIVKKNLISLVLDELESKFPGISDLSENLTGIVGIIFTNDNPFTLFKFIQKNKSAAPAKAGQIAPTNIVVPAGPTSFAPGPIIGELGALKIKAGINAGKVEIKEDAIVAKEGDVISPNLAAILSRLGIEPMEVGLNIKGIYEAGTIYKRSVLDVDEKAILNNLKTFAQDCFKLSIGIEYYAAENIDYFLGEGGRDSLALGVGIAYPAAQTIARLLGKAQSQMVGLATNLPEEVRPAGLAVSAAPVASANAVANEEPKKEEKKESEADAAASFGNFF